MPENMSALDKISLGENLLDKLTEATGRNKCGMICVLNDILNGLRNDILILEAQLNDAQQPKEEAPAQPAAEKKTKKET